MKSSWSRGFTRYRSVYRLGWGLILAPVLFPAFEAIDKGEVLFPSVGEFLSLLPFSAVGLVVTWWWKTPAAVAAESDDHTHRPWVDRLEHSDGTEFQGMCDCGWEGRVQKKPKKAAVEAYRHVARIHWEDPNSFFRSLLRVRPRWRTD
jgi:hypothetical protein